MTMTKDTTRRAVLGGSIAAIAGTAAPVAALPVKADADVLAMELVIRDLRDRFNNLPDDAEGSELQDALSDELWSAIDGLAGMPRDNAGRTEGQGACVHDCRGGHGAIRGAVDRRGFGEEDLVNNRL